MGTSRRPIPTDAILSIRAFIGYLLLSMFFLFDVIFGHRVLLPAGLLDHIYPYAASSTVAHAPMWDPLHWDGIGQFYPWRLLAARAIRTGTIPLWNPYQFCGTPFIANSQSAVFYPAIIIFVVFSVARAFAYSACLHLALAGWFCYLLCRSLGRSWWPAFTAGVIFAWCGWQIAWLELPSFLATSCWIPLILRQIYLLAHNAERRRLNFCLLGAATGLMLLAGHLQIAFYGLLASFLYAAAQTVRCPHRGRFASMYVLATITGFMICSPQLLLSIELSHMSHRVSKPSAAGYKSYVGYALQPGEIVQTTLPDFYGNDHDRQNRYWGFYTMDFGGQKVAVRHNFAETTSYVSILGLLFAALGGVIALRRNAHNNNYIFFLLLAALALLMALGTPVDALFYFGVPGFGQSGSPARVLVLWSLACAVLASLGMEEAIGQRVTRREAQAALLVVITFWAGGLALAARSIASVMPGFQQLGVPLLGDALGRLSHDWLRLILMTAAGTAILLYRRQNQGKPHYPRVHLGPGLLCCALVTADLFSTGYLMNPTAQPSQVYPVTAGIKQLQAEVGHQRIWPVNSVWSLDQSPPAVLPPNGATVYQLRDVQGYDSLFTGQYKAYADRFARVNAAGLKDSSPPEVGNMVFFQNPNVSGASDTAARFVVTLPAQAEGSGTVSLAPSTQPIYQGEDMNIYPLKNAVGRCSTLLVNGQPGPKPTFLRDGLNNVSVKVTMPTTGYILLQDEYYPGWLAAINGHRAPISRNQRVFREVALPSGPSTITFSYVPAAYRLGVYLLCLAASIFAGVISWRPSITRPRANGDQLPQSSP